MEMTKRSTRCNINTKLLSSKKFRAALIAAISSVLTFCVSEFGFKLDIEKTMSLISVITLPLMLYIGAEGYSERDAKVTMLESKNRSEISDKVIEKLVTDLKEPKE